MSVKQTLFLFVSVIFITNCSSKLKTISSYNNDRKKMKYVLDEILSKSFSKEILYLNPSLKIRTEKDISFIDMQTSRINKFFKINTSSFFTLTNLESFINYSNIQLITESNLENNKSINQWFYLSPIVKLDSINEKYFDFNMDQYDSVIQLISIDRIAIDEDKNQFRNFYLINLYALKTDEKGNLTNHLLCYSGG